MKKIKILYVDDEPTNLLLFETILEKEFDVLTAEDGKKGLNLLSTNKDVYYVFSDMRMPLMNGLEFIGKAISLYPDIKFYLLTGFEITRDIQEALEKGIIKKYYRKPFDMRELSLEINNR